MSQEQYNFLDELGLRNVIDNIKTMFAKSLHLHKLSDVSDYTVDTELSSTSTNPVQNKVLDAEFNAISEALNIYDMALDDKASKEHVHEISEINELQTKLNELDSNIVTTWDELENKPFGEEITVVSNVYPETEIVFTDGSATVDFSDSLVDGEIYALTINEKTYTGTCTKYKTYVCEVDFGDFYYDLGYLSCVSDSTYSGIHKISVDNVIVEVKYLDNKFIDTGELGEYKPISGKTLEDLLDDKLKSDWDTRDLHSYSYIKNRPMYKIINNYGTDYCDVKPEEDYYYCGNVTIDKDELLLGTISGNTEDEGDFSYKITEEDITEYDWGIDFKYGIVVDSSIKQTINGKEYNQHGTYLKYYYCCLNDFTAMYRVYSLTTEKFYTLDERYLPNNVAKVSLGEVGQILEIESVDENGKPLSYIASDKPDLSNAVMTVPQEFTKEQQMHARKNLGLYCENIEVVYQGDNLVFSQENNLSINIGNFGTEIGKTYTLHASNSYLGDLSGICGGDSRYDYYVIQFKDLSDNIRMTYDNGVLTWNGTYFPWESEICSIIISEQSEIVQVEEKYIPNTIARTSVINDLQMNLNELDEELNSLESTIVTSWNDLDDKPFFEEEIPIEKLECDYVCVAGSWDVLIDSFSGNVGGQYRVVMPDGSEYTLKAKDKSQTAPMAGQVTGLKWLGNPTLIEDTGGENISNETDYIDYPFVIYRVYDPVTEKYKASVVKFDNSVTGFPSGTKFTVYLQDGTTETVIKPLEEKFIPDHEHSWNDLNEKPFEVIKNTIVYYNSTITNNYTEQLDITPLEGIDSIFGRKSTLRVIISDRNEEMIWQGDLAYLSGYRRVHTMAGHELLPWGNTDLIAQDEELANLGTGNGEWKEYYASLGVNSDLPIGFYYFNGGSASYKVYIDESKLERTDSLGIYMLTIEDADIFQEHITPLDEKFIPDSIARTTTTDELQYSLDILESKMVTSWNELQDRPFYDEEREKVYITEETEVDFSNGVYFFTNDIYKLNKDSKDIIVSVNGVDYSATAHWNGYPVDDYFIDITNEDCPLGYYLGSGFYDTTGNLGTATVSLFYYNEIPLKQLDEKFIPDSVKIHDWNNVQNKPFGESIETKWLYGETTISTNENGFATIEGNEELLEVFSNTGNIVKVYFNGEYYECETQRSNVGGCYFVRFGDNHEIQLFDGESDLTLAVYDENTRGDFSFGILSKTSTLKQIDEKYIPNTIARTNYVDEAITDTRTYADTQIANLVNSAPETLDTLGELATAFQENAEVVNVLNSAITNKAETTDLIVHTSNTSNPHSVTKEQVGLSNVTNVLQYSADNPPPYPVTSVNGKTGAVTLTSETWTFTLNDGSTVTKKVVVM